MAGDIAVIWNCGAGSAEQSAALQTAIRGSPEVLFYEPGEEQVEAAVQRALADGVRRIVAAGGDGTVSHVVASIVQNGGEPVEFAVLPLGTGNDLARSLGMPLDPQLAWDECCHRPASPMDLLDIRVGDGMRIAANMITAGNTGKYAAAITADMKQRWGPFCYVRGTIDVLQDLDVYQVTLTCDGEEIQFPALNLFLANGRTSGGGMNVAPEANLDDGLLDLVAIRDGTAVDLAALTADYLLANFHDNELVVSRRCRSVRIASEPPIPFSVDGESWKKGTASIRVLENALLAVRGSASDTKG